ncbi:diaminohydroxyphosphoribosylamino-pyrimidine deaminase [Pholiota molesta]|nr:diaminohydroxyphosphoribosylamino-pyrimidine deaminase [Pholiota molesta]
MEKDLEDHIQYMRLAIAEADKCTPMPTAFCVGCLLVVRLPDQKTPPTVLATGKCLSKARGLSSEDLATIFPHSSSITVDDLLVYTDVYTTLEPCSIRTSGLAPCADALVAARVKRCFIGVGEPDDFVKCEGARKLRDAGIEVIWLQGLEAECLSIARKGHEPQEG